MLLRGERNTAIHKQEKLHRKDERVKWKHEVNGLRARHYPRAGRFQWKQDPLFLRQNAQTHE